jgi:hypothetical protein
MSVERESREQRLESALREVDNYFRNCLVAEGSRLNSVLGTVQGALHIPVESPATFTQADIDAAVAKARLEEAEDWHREGRRLFATLPHADICECWACKRLAALKVRG